MAREGLSRNPTALLVKLLRRVLLDCTLDDLAERSGIHADLLSRYERGRILHATDRNLERLLSAAGVLEIRHALLLAVEQLSGVLTQRPPPLPSAADPLGIRELVDRTSRRLALLQPDVPAAARSPRIHPLALLVLFLRKALLDVSQRELSLRTGIHENVLARYEAGKVERPSRENLDRILDAAGVLHLKEPFLQAVNDLADVLARQPAPGKKAAAPEPLLTQHQIDELIAHSIELLGRTRKELGLPEE